MRNLLLLLLALPFYSQSQDSTRAYKLTVELKDLPDSARVSMFYLHYRVDGVRLKDSGYVKNNKAVISGRIPGPMVADLQAVAVDTGNRLGKDYEYMRYSVFLEPGKQKVIARKKLHTTAFTSKGSKNNKLFIGLFKSRGKYENTQTEFYQAYTTARKEEDQAGMDRAVASVDSLEEVIKKEVYLSFLEKHSNSPVAVYALSQYSGYVIDAEKVEPVYERLSPGVKELHTAKRFKEQLETAKKTGIGRIAMDFTQNDTLDQPVSLASFRGKYLLIDFWASWCGPCRAENPNVVRVFNSYKDRDFQVLGVSLDRPGQKERWLKAIHDDQLAWTQVSDLKFWDNEVAKLYGINSIPQNFLLDPEGKIIAKNLRGAELEKALQLAIEGKKAF